MEPDLETRLRRAAQMLDEQAEIRMASNGSDETVPEPSTTSPRRRARWVAAAAAACVVAAGATVLALVGGSGSSPSDDPPAGPTSVPAPTEGVLQQGWNDLPEAPIAPRYAHLTVATDTGIFVWGGSDDPNALFGTGEPVAFQDGAHLDLTTGEWQTTPPFPVDGTTGIAVGAWLDGEVILISQIADPDGNHWYEPGEIVAAAYDPAANTWEELPDPPLTGPIFLGPRSLIAVDGIAVYVEPAMDHDYSAGCEIVWESEERDDDGPTGGAQECDDDWDESTVFTTVARFDPSTREWSQGSPPPTEMYEVAWGIAVGDQALVAGPTGDDSADECSAPLYLYNPTADEWTVFSEGPDEELAIGALTWTGDALFAATPDVCHPGMFEVDDDWSDMSEPVEDVPDDGHGIDEPTEDVADRHDSDDGAVDVVDDVTDGDWPDDSMDDTSGTLVSGPHGPLEGPAEPPEPRGRLTQLSGEHTSFPAPRYVASIHGSWTGTSVAMIGDNGLPLFFDPDSATWHEAPAHEGVDAPGNFDDRGYWRGVDTVWSAGALVSWGGMDLADLDDIAVDENDSTVPHLPLREGGIAYVPPDEYR